MILPAVDVALCNATSRRQVCAVARGGKNQIPIRTFYDLSGVPWLAAGKEKLSCQLNYQTGELNCTGRDWRESCRQPWCPFAEQERTRLLDRLLAKYAPEGRAQGVQLSWPPGTVASIIGKTIRGIKNAK